MQGFTLLFEQRCVLGVHPAGHKKHHLIGYLPALDGRNPACTNAFQFGGCEGAARECRIGERCIALVCRTVCGLMPILAGAGMERVARKYFSKIYRQAFPEFRQESLCLRTAFETTTRSQA